MPPPLAQAAASIALLVMFHSLRESHMTTAAAQNNRPIQAASGDFSPVAGRLGPAGCSGFLRSPGRFAGVHSSLVALPCQVSLPFQVCLERFLPVRCPRFGIPGSVSPPTTVSGPSTIVPGTVSLLSGGFVPGVVPEPGSVVPPPPEPGPSGSGRSGSGLIRLDQTSVNGQVPPLAEHDHVGPAVGIGFELRVGSFPAPLIVNL